MSPVVLIAWDPTPRRTIPVDFDTTSDLVLTRPNDTMLKALKWKHALSTTLSRQPVQRKEQNKSESGTGLRCTKQMGRFYNILIMEFNYFKPPSDLFPNLIFFMPKPNQANEKESLSQCNNVQNVHQQVLLHSSEEICQLWQPCTCRTGARGPKKK